MNIGKIAKKSGLSVRNIRYYDEIKLVSPSYRDNETAYRDYNDNDLKKLIFIRRARTFGFTLNNCQELLNLYEDDNRASKEVKKIAQNRLTQIKEKQNELQKLHDDLQNVVNHCEGNSKSKCSIIDFLSS